MRSMSGFARYTLSYRAAAAMLGWVNSRLQNPQEEQ